MRRANCGVALYAVAVSVAAIALIVAVAPVHGGDGSLAYRKVALTGESSPGTEPGTTFSIFTTGLNHSIMVPRIDEVGRVAFIAIIDGIGVDETNRSGIWAESGDQLSLVVRTGSQAPGTPPGMVFAGLPSEYLPFPPQFAGGQAVFQGVLTGPGVDSSNDDGVWIGGPEGLALVARETDAAPGAPGAYFSNLAGSSDPQGATRLTATLAGAGVSTANNDSIWSDRTGELALIAREGDPAPGMDPGVVFGSGNTGAAYTFPRSVFNDTSALAVQANLVGPGVDSFTDECVFVERDGALELVARDGDHAPGVENPSSGNEDGVFGGGSVSAGIYQLVHNDLGHVAFSIRVGGFDWNVGVVYSDRSGTLWPEVKPGDLAPGTGEPFTIFGSPMLNDQDRIAFSASVETGQWPPTGIYWDQPGLLAPLVVPGQELAGMTVTGTAGILGFNAAGDIGFRAGLVHPVDGFKSGLVLADGQGTLRMVAATGDSFDVHGDGSDMREILRIEPGGLSESGSVVFRLDFTDGSSGHFVATARNPGGISGLRVAKVGSGGLELSWDADCAGSGTHGVYRGDLSAGLISAGPEPGQCGIANTSVTVPMGVGDRDFFLVVPNTGMSEGSYGSNSQGELRPAALAACFPQSTIASCAR